MSSNADLRSPKKQRSDEMEDQSAKDGAPLAVMDDAQVPAAVAVGTSASKRPRKMETKKTNTSEPSLHQTDSPCQDQTPAFTIRPSDAPTPTLLYVSNLPKGVTVKVLADVFVKYGGLIGVRPMQGRAAIVQYRFTDVACNINMRSQNHGRSVADTIISVDFVHMCMPPIGPKPMQDDDTAGASTISTKDGTLPPSDSPGNWSNPNAAGVDKTLE